MSYNYRELLNLQKRRKIYIRAQDFLDDCARYFQWCIENPLQEEELFHNRGAIVRTDRALVRAFTKTGMCAFIGIPDSRIAGYRDRGGEWAEAVELLDQVIYTQKFENAAANLLNASIIGRDLGLTEKHDVKTKEVATPDPVDESRIANVMHPSASIEDLDRYYAAGKEPPMYTTAQIEAGVPWVTPDNV